MDLPKMLPPGRVKRPADHRQKRWVGSGEAYRKMLKQIKSHGKR